MRAILFVVAPFLVAETVPSFSLDYAREKATHIVVVEADGTVLESWRGELGRGAKVPFKAGSKPIAVANPFPKEPRDPNIESVSGKRRVLFLIKNKKSDTWTPAGYLLPEERFATVWIEKGQCFAIYQFTNPGHGAMMHPLYMDEKRLKKEVEGKVHKPSAALPVKDPNWARFQVSGSPIKALSAAEIAKRPVLKNYLKEWETKGGRVIVYTVDEPVYEISSEPLAKLFPTWTFYVVSYQMDKHPDYKESVSIADGLYYVLGLNDRGERKDFFGYGNYEGFGELMAAQKIRLRTLDEAKQIYAACCHLYRKWHPDAPHRRAGPTEWHFAPRVVGDREYYYEVRTSEDGTVVSGRLQSVVVKQKRSR